MPPGPPPPPNTVLRFTSYIHVTMGKYNNYMYSNNYNIIYTPLLSSLGSLYRYRNTKWNMVPSFAIATLYHLYTTDFRHPTNTMHFYGVPTFTQHAFRRIFFTGNCVNCPSCRHFSRCCLILSWSNRKRPCRLFFMDKCCSEGNCK